jgi:adenosylmethionine---8-amino-7-oxononanoate aminotransferase
MNEKTAQWLAWDRQHCWHPFTNQLDWCAPSFEPLIIERGQGVWLWDSEGRKYFDGNSSIWTNIHGHAHPHINAALQAQMEEISHSSFLGFGNARASELAAALCRFFPPNTLERVFFSDDGSTAVECAVKMALQYRMQSGEAQRTTLVAFTNAYHGDTMGAASLGGVSLFFERFRKFGMDVSFVRNLDELFLLDSNTIAAVVIEPLIQGVNQMHLWPAGMLQQLRGWCDANHVHLILDEVMTGFGRSGTMFACEQEDVIPDFLCLAKGLTGGYLPLAATMTTDAVYRAFLGSENTFYYGHSYTANPLGCAAALANLQLFETENTIAEISAKADTFGKLLEANFPHHVIRRRGMMAGIEVRQNDGSPYAASQQIGARICYAARNHGLLTRPIRDTIVLMPPLCSSIEELRHAVTALRAAMEDVCGKT